MPILDLSGRDLLGKTEIIVPYEIIKPAIIMRFKKTGKNDPSAFLGGRVVYLGFRRSFNSVLGHLECSAPLND
jgi:hypothetical protein